MRKKSPYLGPGVLFVGILVLVAVAAASTDITGLITKPVSSCPKLSQASLNVETQGCPSSFGPPFAEERTSWKIEKSADTESPLINTVQNQVDRISYTVKVIEGKTTHVLMVKGQLIITNGGQQTPGLTNIDANLQTKVPGSKFTTKASAIAAAADACRQQQRSPTCFGTLQNSPGSSLTLIDVNGNDVTALLGNVPIPPVRDANNTCLDAVKLNYVAEFDTDKLGLTPGQQVRLEMLVTFLGAGARGGSPETVSCTLDADCNGVISDDDATTCNLNEGENNNVRTVPTRNSFTVPTFTPVCANVMKTDDGATSQDPGCAQVSSNSLSAALQRRFEGATDIEQIFGTVSCVINDCQTAIDNEAVLTCGDGRNELIEGSPAAAGIAKICQIEDVTKPEPGDFCTFTQGGWGAVCRGSNPGCYRDVFFGSVFPTGVGIGQGVSCAVGLCGQSPVLDGAPLFAAKWTTPLAVQDFLPAGGTPGKLTADLQNPFATSSEVLDGQLLAATLAVAFDDAGMFDMFAPFIKNDPTKKLGDLTYQGGTPCDGLTVRQALDAAHQFASGAPSPFSASDLNTCLTLLNEGFDGCAVADSAHFKK